MRLRRFLLSVATFSALGAPGAWADEGWGEGVEVMADADLEAHRGGFQVAGLDVNFGAVVTTYVDGAPALTTQLTWTDAGALIEETIGAIGQNMNDLSPDQIEALGVAGLDHAGGVVLDDEAGVTAILHNVGDGALQNIIINNATGRDLTQRIDVTLTLPGFETIQAQLITDRFGIKLDDDLRAWR